MDKRRVTILAVVFALIVMPGAWAQDTGSGTFTGVVRDSSGAVLPGVIVEVASPALIEKVRTATTDSEGRYRIAALRPGVYSVTFTLPGFRTMRRDGIDLTTGFVATVNGELSVGALEETITVTGAAPVVDLKNSSQQQVFSGEVIRELPIGKNSGVFAALLPGAVQNSLSSIDVGGTKGETENNIGIHGGRPLDGLTFREGNYDGHMFGSRGSNAVSSINPATIQEVTLQLTGGLTAEAQSGGIQNNVVLRDGGNVLSGTFIVDYGHRNLQASNIDDALRARGVTTAAFIDSNYDVASGVGGPIRRNKLWLFVDARRWKAYSQYPGQYFNARQDSLLYEPDLSRPGISGTQTRSFGARVTWQATDKNKIAMSARYESTCNCFINLGDGLRAPEATWHAWYYPYRVGQVAWTYPATNRLLFQSSVLVTGAVFTRNPDSRVLPATISILDRLRNYRYGASDNYVRSPFAQGNGVASVSYIAGSHALKLGGMYMRAIREENAYNFGSISYTFAGPVPESVTYYAYPNVLKSGVNQSAVYGQDQWTAGDLTLNLGLRFDFFSGYAPETHSSAGRWVPARDFPAAGNTVNWKDINPRLGASYNLFGDDRTAIKVNLGRFIGFEPLGGLAAATLPANLIVTSATRTWSDANRDYIPQDNELGPLSNANFGNVVSNTAYKDDVIKGWGARSYSWQGSVSVQHELLPRVGVNVGYFRTWYGNFTATDNVLVSASDYDSYCVTGPADARLPGGGGERICGLMAIAPSLFGRVSNLVAPASDYGKQSEVYNGIDFTVNARFGRGGLLSGGLSTSQTVTDRCEVLANLPELAPTSAPGRFCDVAPPWSGATQIKLFGSYPLPASFRASVVYQNMASVPTTATYVATNAQVTPQLGRPLAGGTNATASVELLAPNTLFQEDRLNLLNVGITRVVRVGTLRMQPSLDLHNALNANSILRVNVRYGPAWRTVQGVLPPRMIKLAVRVDF